MNNDSWILNRRDFLKKSLAGVGSLLILPNKLSINAPQKEWPIGEQLGRNVVYQPNTLSIRSAPDENASVIRILTEDECVPWNREVIGSAPRFSPSKKWLETQEGYIFSPSLQKVKYLPNQPVIDLPVYNDERGMWCEVTVPYVNLELANPPARSPWILDAPQNLWRLYYSQVVWVDEIITNSDGIQKYRIVEKYGSYGDIFWADATAFRPISEEEVSPIHPDVGDKKILVNVNSQTLSCFEGDREVYFCQIASGKKNDVFGNPDDSLKTPAGEHRIWRKLISLHMSGGASGAGWDTMAVPWTSLFVGSGVAIHGAFWHNDFGTPKSHGCVNTTAEDAKWIFRWTTPQVSYYPGDLTINTFDGTKIEVVEPLY